MNSTNLLVIPILKQKNSCLKLLIAIDSKLNKPEVVKSMEQSRSDDGTGKVPEFIVEPESAELCLGNISFFFQTNLVLIRNQVTLKS